jgi:multiple sugar transport system permease protein
MRSATIPPGISKTLKEVIWWALTLLMLGVFLFPIAWVALSSLKKRIDLLAIPPKLFFIPTLANYQNMLIAKRFVGVFLNSIVISLVATFASLLLGTLAAYVFSRYRVRGSRNLLFWILSTRMFPPIAAVLPYFVLMSQLRLLDTYISLILLYTTFNLPLVIWMMKEFFDELPLDLEEAALVDGCSRFGSFWRISLPLVAPGMAATAVLTLIFSWNEFLIANILTGPNTRTVPVAVAGLVASHETDWGGVAAMGTLSLVPVMIFIFFVQKQLVRGLTLGAVKG